MRVPIQFTGRVVRRPPICIVLMAAASAVFLKIQPVSPSLIDWRMSSRMS